MNTMAIPETASSVTHVVSRPAPSPRTADGAVPGGTPDAAATVVRFRSRAVKERTAGKPASEVPGTGEVPGTSQALDTRQVLDPQSSEKDLLAEMSRRISQAALEVLSGSRSVQQLARWLDPMCLSALTTRARLHAAACLNENRHPSPGGENSKVQILRHQPIVHSTHVCAVSPGIYETSVVIADKTRFRAIAMRFEETGGAWKVTALQIG